MSHPQSLCLLSYCWHDSYTQHVTEEYLGPPKPDPYKITEELKNRNITCFDSVVRGGNTVSSHLQLRRHTLSLMTFSILQYIDVNLEPPLNNNPNDVFC